MAELSKRLQAIPIWFPVVVVLALGCFLRLVWPLDMEFKADEATNFGYATSLLPLGEWPLLGMHSSVGLPNPGLSCWLFMVLGRSLAVTNPPDLARAIQLINCSALILLAFFALRIVERKDRAVWLWTLALACVNPIDLLYQRKIWAQSCLPLFSMSLLVAWWFKDRRSGAFLWGLLGALLGQIHMSGYFLAAAFVLWTGLFARRDVKWGCWLAGSLIGLIPMLPWLAYLAAHRGDLGHSANLFGFFEQISERTHPLTGQLDGMPLQFLWVWLGNASGVALDWSLRYEWLEFLRYPLIQGAPTYLAFIASLLAGILTLVVIAGGWRELFLFRGKAVTEKTWLCRNAGFIALGVLFTLSPVFVFQNYLLVAFPIVQLWVAMMARQFQQGKKVLLLLFACQLILSLTFLYYLHVNGGAPQGDYGVSYRRQISGQFR